jgi:hypothetical protein
MQLKRKKFFIKILTVLNGILLLYTTLFKPIDYNNNNQASNNSNLNQLFVSTDYLNSTRTKLLEILTAGIRDAMRGTANQSLKDAITNADGNLNRLKVDRSGALAASQPLGWQNRSRRLFDSLQTIQGHLIDLGANTTTSPFVEKKANPIFTRKGDLYIVSEIDINSPWYKKIVRNNALYIKTISKGIGYGAKSAAAIIAPYLTKRVGLAIGASVTTGALLAGGLFMLGALAWPVTLTAAGIATGAAAIVASSAGVTTYKSLPPDAQAAALKKAQEQAVEEYVLKTKVSPLQFLIARMETILFQEERAKPTAAVPNPPAKPLQSFTICWLQLSVIYI